MSDFLNKRRQQFITENFYISLKKHYADSPLFWSQNTPQADSPEQAASLASYFIAKDLYALFSLSFTAGESILALRPQLEAVVSAYEKYAQLLQPHEEGSTYPVFAFQEIDEFEGIMQLIGLAYLLHRRDLIPHIHALIANSAYDGVDAVYEEMIGHVLPDRPYLENWYHQLPYLHLLNSTDMEEDGQKSAELATYCKAWYPAMKKCSWHDSHLRMTETDGDYFGYWAFEAGAIAYLYGIDDSEIDHMVYPKDLVAFAREFVPDEQPKTENRKGE